jgi:hypothetical protein
MYGARNMQNERTACKWIKTLCVQRGTKYDNYQLPDSSLSRCSRFPRKCLLHESNYYAEVSLLRVCMRAYTTSTAAIPQNVRSLPFVALLVLEL